jgi:hypothetical protein
MAASRKFNIYLGTLLISAASLALEVALTRLLSVITWYHLAFFAVSTAMLGITAGAVTVYFKPNWFVTEKLTANIAKACLGYAIAIPYTLMVLCRVPINSGISITNLLVLLAITLACALPFYFSGIAITAVLTKFNIPIGKLYASDLTGAALGCLLVLGGLEIFSAVILIMICGGIAILSAFCFIWKVRLPRLKRLSILVLLVLTLIVLASSYTSFGIHPVYVKGNVDNYNKYILEKWNSFSRVVVYKEQESSPMYWGASPLAPRDIKIPQYKMNIDGSAATTLSKYSTKNDIQYLGFDITNIVHYLRPYGAECIIGAGAGRDIQSALLYGHEKIVAIEMNPIFFDLLQGKFREFAGVADRPGISLIVDEARSYLSRTSDKFNVIQMSLVDTWAATGAGAFSLSENSLYTLEAWHIFMNHLADDGIFTVSRWYDPNNPVETGRLLSLATATLLESGITSPSQHIAMVTSQALATLLVSKQPLSPDEVVILQSVTSQLEFKTTVLPYTLPSNPVLAKIVNADSLDTLRSSVAEEPYNLEPPTDESPYFFNMLKLNHLGAVNLSGQGVLFGNQSATLTLLGLIISTHTSKYCYHYRSLIN